MAASVERVRNRLLRATRVLGESQIPYAVVGGNAVAAWVGEVDEAAVRNTQDVDILLRRADLERAKGALAGEGFVYRVVSGITMFLDGPGAKARDAVHIIFAGEKVRAEYEFPAPNVDESRPAEHCQVLGLEALVRMKLTSNRDKDRTHIRDLIAVGLLDRSWLSRLPLSLQTRLQSILDSPEG
jgi:hypothetical protein